MASIIAAIILIVGIPLAVSSRPSTTPGDPLTLQDFQFGAGILLTCVGGLGLISALIAMI